MYITYKIKYFLDTKMHIIFCKNITIILAFLYTYRTHTNALLHHNFIYDFPFCSWPRLPIIHKKMIWSSFYQMYQYQQTHSLYVEYSRPSEGLLSSILFPQIKVQFFFKFISAFWHSCRTNFEWSSTYCRVASSRPVYNSMLNSFGQRSQ